MFQRSLSWKSSIQRYTHTLASSMSFCAKGSLANKNKNFGEDGAVIKTWITPGAQQGSQLIGVADGVGGWRRHGVDTSFLSQGLLRELGLQFEESERHDPPKNVSCQEMLVRAFSLLINQRNQYAGGTTVCFGKFNPSNAQAEILNIGDSGALLFRNNRLVERTSSDVEGMTPRQLTVLPPWMTHLKKQMEPQPKIQTKTDTLKWQTEAGDVLVFATDGFFDNVSEKDTNKLIRQTLEKLGSDHPGAAKEIAENLLMRAYYSSLDPDFASPFALRRLKEDAAYDYWGGKPDDITVLVSIVQEADFMHHSKV